MNKTRMARMVDSSIHPIINLLLDIEEAGPDGCCPEEWYQTTVLQAVALGFAVWKYPIVEGPAPADKLLLTDLGRQELSDWRADNPRGEVK